VDRGTAKVVAGVARLRRRAAALIRVRADEESRQSSAAVLIIFALLWTMTRELGRHHSMLTERGN
jgi:hypothetical protein